MSEKSKRSSRDDDDDDDDENHLPKHPTTDYVIAENPVVDETDDDLDWLMDTVVRVSPAATVPVEDILEEEVRKSNESEYPQVSNNFDDYFNLTVIEFSISPPSMPWENLFEHPVLDAVPQIPDWIPAMLSEQYLLIALILNSQLIGITSVNPDLDFMEDEILDDLIASIGTGTDIDDQLAALTSEEDN